MAVQLQKNLWRLDIPLEGNPLKNLNSYLITGERSLLIDTGFCWQSCREAMQRELTEIGVDQNRMDIFLTHLHSDHAGLASELVRPGCEVFISEIDGPRIISPLDTVRWNAWYEKYLPDGFSQQEIDEIHGKAPSQSGACTTVCEFHLIQDGHTFSYGDYHLLCILTPGHTPGHMCLYDAEKKILFSGDHVLFHISPNICRWNDVPDSLGDYLTSLVQIRPLSVELLLPAHREETGNLQQRVDELLEHHSRRIAETLRVVTEAPGLNAYEIAGKMSWRIRSRTWTEFPLTQKLFAVGETLAHLDYLEVRGKVTHHMEQGKNIYFPSF